MIILTPAVFGWEHLTYTSIALMLIVIGAVLCRLFLKEERSRSIAVRITGAILLALILWNRICIMNDAIDAGGTALSIIPNTFCGLASLTTALALLVVKKDSNLLHFILYLGLLGGFLTLIYPDFVSQDESFFYPNTISGLLHHTVLFWAGILCIVTGYITPSMEKYRYYPLGLMVFLVIGLFEIDGLGFAGAMYIHSPLIEGTPLTWYLVGALALLLHFIVLFLWETIVNRRKAKDIFRLLIGKKSD